MTRRPVISRIDVRAYRVPTEQPETDGTLAWNATELVLVEASSGGVTGLGYSYTGGRAAAALIRDRLAPLLLNHSALAPTDAWDQMNTNMRNLGRPGLGMMAVAAVDIALWDLKARLLGLSLVDLWGRRRTDIPAYGSGGFTSLSDGQLQERARDWIAQGFGAIKIKVGSRPQDDARRVQLVRQAAGPDAALMVDANGAYEQKQALHLAQQFAACGVCWFEEPVSSDDLAGLRSLRRGAPPGMAVAAGEYGWDVRYFRRMLQAEAVDVLQVDATRCGYTGFLQAAALCEGFGVPLSAHCAPAIHAPVCATVPRFKHLEYFHDHQRLESIFFDGLPLLRDGCLRLLDTSLGHGLKLRREETESYRLE